LHETLKDLEVNQEEISALLMQIHLSCVESGATPLHFFQLLDNYKHILSTKVSSQSGESKHLIAGLDKLHEAAELVDKLSKKAQEQKILLKEKQSEADAALDKINVALEKKAERKQEAEKLKRQCIEDQDIIQERKVLIDEELVDIMPAVEAARAQVGNLKTENINEIKAYKVPPDAVHDVLGAVLLIMGVRDTTWTNMKKFLGGKGVVQSIMNFDAHYITKDIRDSVNKVIIKKKNSFEQKTIASASRACAPLAAWVIANVKYSEVLLKIEPLEREMNGLMAELNKSEARVAECTRQLDELEESTKILNDELKQKTNEAATLKYDLERAEQTLNSAQNLLLQLSGEKDRWEIQVEEIKNNVMLLPYKSLLSAGYIIYTGKDDEKLRHQKITEWKQMVKDESFDFIKFMCTESQLLQWKTEGLPADELSMENAIMLRNTVKTPIIFDPATQATEWIKHTLKNEENAVEFLPQNDPKYNTKLEISIRFGKTCVIEEVDGVDKMLFPVLRKDLIHQGPRWVVQCGDKTVDYNDQFRLFFATRDSFLDIPPNASPLVCIVNFTVTKSGLESQLLSITINHEEPELERKKTEILQEEEKFKIKLAEYQKSLLDELANSTGNILENKQLVDSLNNTKTQAAEIEKALVESHKFQESLDTQRNIYRTFAAIGADLFMVIEDLIKVNNMYQFSLASFIVKFKKALASKPSASSTDEKLKLLSDTLIKLVFFEIGTSLFKDDRLTYGLHFVHGIYPKLFQEGEWEFFNGTAVATSDSSQQLPRWSTPDRKSMFNSFASLFPKLVRFLQLDDESLWNDFATATECEKHFPSSIKTQVSSFQRVLVIKTFRPDRLETAMNTFVCEALGKKSIAPAPLSIKSLYQNDTDCQTPILFIISPGSDPSDELQEFAGMEIGRQGYHELAMGGGDNQIAIHLIKDAAEKGEWVCLKNLHLVTPWLTTLEKEFKLLTPDKKFRLWLTSEPHAKFPSILLKSSLTVTYESPPGIKNNLQRTYQSWAPTFDEGNLLKAQTLFILAWFNSVIQERRKYIPQGWSKYYEFSYGDLKAGETILSEIIDQAQGQLPQWEIVNGLLENAIYGGRVDNPFDMRVLRTYLKQFFTPDVFQGTKKLSNLIQVPKAATIKDYIQYVSQLPDQDKPMMFGLPQNIDRSVQRFNSQRYINMLKNITAVSKEDLKFDRETWSQALGPILRLWKSIYKPDVFRSIKIGNKINSEDPVEAFTFMEADNMLNTLRDINMTLSSIAKILKGTLMLTSKIEQEATALLKREVPESWCKFWDGPDNSQDWLIKFEKKASALASWVDRASSGSLLDSALDLSDLFHPETFFNALRQKSGRELKCPIDALKLASAFERKQLGGKITVSLEGMYLQGAGFESGQIVDQSSEHLQELLPLPACNIAWIKSSDADPYHEGSTVDVPVYFTILRENLLCELKVPNSGSADERIISGVAIFLDGSD
jgi:dynein heavy chain 2